MPTQIPARAKLFQMAEDKVPAGNRVFGEGSYLRPNFLQPYRCKNVLIEGVTLHRAPMWQVHRSNGLWRSDLRDNRWPG